MTEPVPEIVMVPVHSVNVLNPRSRNRKVFNELVTSISHLGLKRPITVSRRAGTAVFDLVCGQGRLEAFIALGQKEIPAVILDVEEEDCFVMSLVENLARRQHSPLELVEEIGALKKRGYSIDEIARKTDFSTEYIYALCYLLETGEERLINGVERGIIPVTVAMEIAKAKDSDVQVALADAYENKALPGNQVLAIRRIIEIRNTSGKGMRGRGSSTRRDRTKATADLLVRAYRQETDRQKALIKKATLAQSRLLFIVNALRRLVADEHFTTLLRAEAIQSMPLPLAERIGMTGGHLRLAVLVEQGAEEVRCLVADDDERFTYNKRVNRLATIQEHYMIVCALDRGVSEEKLARALNLDVKAIKRRRNLLDGVCPEVIELLGDKTVNARAFEVLRKMKPIRQIEVAELMIAVNNYSMAYVQALLGATRQADLVNPEKPKKVGALTPEQMARLERETAMVNQDFKALEESYGDDVLNLVVASGYVAKLVSNAEIVRYLTTRHPELLSELRVIVGAVSLDQGGTLAA